MTNNSVVLITGGLTGIGRAAAVAFAKKGAKVVVAGRRDEAGKALVEELRAFGSEAEFINADVRKEDDVRNMVDKTVARFGRLDVAVNNAATEGAVGPITDQTAESFAATFETNVLGVVLSMKHEVRAMQAQGSGSIINISSTYGHEGAAFASIYVGAKHAVEGITKSVALEVAKSGIRVNAVAPGPTDTGMLTRFTGTAENKAALAKQVPLGRLGLSEEVADGIVFIASDEARFITGHVLSVDGGQHRRLTCSGFIDRDYTREGSPMANVVKKHSISFELAQKMVDAALAKAKELGVTENVAIVDDGGNLKAFGRMDGAPILSIQMAQNKAYTALFGVSTQEFFNFIQGDPSLLAGIPTLSRVAAWGGGFPIKVNGEVVGAIGLSGAPAVQNDVDCAKAALALVPDAIPEK